jgi:pSer/pThr/pTyr-binding forkhead associated (FHA) protein
MPVLQLNDQQFPLQAGTTRVGAGGGADVSLPGDPGLGVQAIIDRTSDKTATVRRASPTAQVRVNGVLLGAEPMPLMHGDKVEIVGLEVRFADDAKGGATQFVSASEIAAMAGTKRSGVARPTTASGGRLVSLVDGKEYTVLAAGIVLGRDASCDVVVAQNEVSRRHAEIAPTEQGYVVRDMSANGVFVNGERVQGSQRLARSDVVRVGGEEFRFYADLLAQAPTPPAPQPAVQAPAPSQSPPTPAHASLYSAPTPLAQPAWEDPRPVVATLEMRNEGPTKGSLFSLRTPLVHVGRGAHNDVRLSDESVSETHAKLQRREDGWYLVDMDSTNGTYVGGTRVAGERKLEGSPDIRFGGVKMRFAVAVTDAPAETEAKGTRAIASVERPRRGVAEAPAAGQVAAQSEGSGAARWVWTAVALAVAAGVFFALKGRA